MAATGAKQTRAETVRDLMRQDILGGVMKPGQRLMFPDLCTRYGASVGVTREALAALATQGLVRTVAHHGYRVTPISADDLQELVQARSLVEPLVLTMAMRNGGLEWEASLMSTFHVMRKTPRTLPEDPAAPNPAWAQVHDAFHQALFAPCGNGKLLEITRLLSEDAALYRRWSDSVDSESRDVVAEHEGLLDAAIAGDAERATRLLTEHIERTARRLIPYAEE